MEQMPPPMQGNVAQPAQQPQPQQESGLRAVQNVGFNQDIQNVLLSRIQNLGEEEGRILDAFITPETVPVLVKIFPELEPLFNMLGKNDGGAPIQQPQMAEQENPILSDVPSGASRGLTG